MPLKIEFSTKVKKFLGLTESDNLEKFLSESLKVDQQQLIMAIEDSKLARVVDDVWNVHSVKELMEVINLLNNIEHIINTPSIQQAAKSEADSELLEEMQRKMQRPNKDNVAILAKDPTAASPKVIVGTQGKAAGGLAGQISSGDKTVNTTESSKNKLT